MHLLAAIVGAALLMVTLFDMLTPEFALLGQQHLAYPVLHYFQDVERDAAIAVAVPARSSCGVRSRRRPSSCPDTRRCNGRATPSAHRPGTYAL